MSALKNIGGDRRHLLEKRMANQDLHQTLSPQHQHQNSEGIPVNNLRSEGAIQSSTLVLIESSAKVDEKLSLSRTSGNMAGDNNGNISLIVPLVATPSVASTVHFCTPTLATNAATIIELPFSDESKVSENSRSHSRSIHSPALKGDKDKENKTDNVSRNLKRQSNNSFENKSPKLSKNDENNPSDHISAVCAGWSLHRTDVLNRTLTVLLHSVRFQRVLK